MAEDQPALNKISSRLRDFSLASDVDAALVLCALNFEISTPALSIVTETRRVRVSLGITERT